ncbi:MAG: fatty acid desaturase [Spirochaetales bacterium]
MSNAAMQPKIKWYRTPIDRDTLRELTTPSDFKGFLHSFAFLLIYLATTAVTLFFFLREQWWLTGIAAYVHCMFVGFVGMGAAVHELSHGTAFKRKWLNNFFFKLFAFLSWNSYFHFKESHRRHHQLTSYDKYDFENPTNPVPFTWWSVVQWFTFDFSYLKMLLWTNLNHAFGNTDVDFFFWCPLIRKDDIRTKSLIRWARFMIVGHVLLAAAFIYSGLWILVITVSFSPFIASFLIHACHAHQHTGLNRNVPDWRVNAYSAEFGPVMSFLYWNMNYHAEHHMYAAVPFYNLPKLHKLVKHDFPIPIKGFLPGILHVIRVKLRHVKDPEYRYVPEFPDTATPPQMGDVAQA